MAYASFMVRLWREEGVAVSTPDAKWQSEIQHIQSGRSWTFTTLDELLDFIRRQADDPTVIHSRAREK